jgi:transketolase
VLVGDGELDEGSNHEAIALAGRLGLDRLTAVAVDNGSASLGWPNGIAARFAVEGWHTVTVDGRNHESLYEALATTHDGRPLAVIARIGQEVTR